MTSKLTIIQKPGFQQFLLILGIILISINLRPALAGVGPLISAIRQDTRLTNTMLGLLTTLPLLAFGFMSSLTPFLARRLGIEGTLAGAMVLLTFGTLVRVIPSSTTLFSGTLLIGIAIALANVLLPSLVKRDFPKKTGLMTSVYSSVLGIGATLAAGISVPLAENAGWGWRWSLGFWAILSFVALLVWLPQLKNQTIPRSSRNITQALRNLGGSGLAWNVAFFMGLQSLTFYIILAWLPEILQNRGMEPEYAGWMLSLSQAMGVLGSLLIPPWAAKRDDQRPVVWVLIILELTSLTGLMLPDILTAPLWVSTIGFTLGGSFGLSLLFIILRTSDTETATELSGMAQSVGYLLAATGPILFGFLHDLTMGWTIPLLLLIIIMIIKLMAGLGAGKPLAID